MPVTGAWHNPIGVERVVIQRPTTVNALTVGSVTKCGEYPMLASMPVIAVTSLFASRTHGYSPPLLGWLGQNLDCYSGYPSINEDQFRLVLIDQVGIDHPADGSHFVRVAVSVRK